MTVTSTKTEMQELSLGLDGGEQTLVFKIGGSNQNVLDWIEERYDADLVAGVGYRIKKLVTHPLYDWMVLSNVKFVPWQPDDRPASGSDFSWNFAEGIRVIETYTARSIGTDLMGGSGNVETVLGRYLVHQREASSEIQTQPGQTWEWVSDGADLPPDIYVGMSRPQVAHRITWIDVPSIPRTNITKALGTVNSSVLSLGSTISLPDCGANETLLFDSWSDDGGHYDQYGNVVYTLDFVFLEWAVYEWQSGTWIGWNYQFRESTGLFGEIKAKNSARHPYEPSNLNTIFSSF